MLLYSVCTISRQESEAVIDRFLEERPDFRPDPPPMAGASPDPAPWTAGDSHIWPDRDGTDGFFIARLRRC
jgi:16S rRNA C967 or C1407 C5-methylase (RsmB/RsmF family)